MAYIPQFKRTNVSITKFSDKTPAEMLNEIAKRGNIQIHRAARNNEAIEQDLKNMVDSLTDHLIAQSIRNELSEIFKSFAELGFAEADLFYPGLSSKFIKLSRYGGETFQFGMFLEEGIFGICEGCKTLISKTRLKAVPYARFCIKCQEKKERR